MVRKQVIVCLCCLFFLVGCSDYGEVSHVAYQYSQALYSICNRQDQDKLARFQEKLAVAIEKDELSEQEADWLNDIVATASSGNWKAASRQARKLMEDQVRWP